MAEENTAPKASGAPSDTFRRVYDDTVYFIDSIVHSYDVFPAILQVMREGDATIELKKRYLLRAIDETWVNMIEDTLPALDMIIRNPSKYIEEREEILPIELSRNISSRSLKHLSQHTNMISRIEGDTIIPSKLLNVFREETLQTYENKFVNTLINRLYIFVSRRYEIAKKDGQDEKTTSIDFSQNFTHGRAKGKMHFRIEIAEPADGDDKVEKNYVKTTDLWRRVERLNNICTAYQNSDFCNKMGKSYIHPPVMRTNAILKNKNLRQCLELWQFIESFEGAGYSMLVQEDLEKVDEQYLRELYSTLALQYLIFRYNIRNEFDASGTLDSRITEDLINPRIVDKLSALTAEEFNITAEERRVPIPSMIRYGTLTPEDKMMLQSIDIALAAAERMRQSPPEREPEHAHIPEPAPAPEYSESAAVTALEEAIASAAQAEGERSEEAPSEEKQPEEHPEEVKEEQTVEQIAAAEVTATAESRFEEAPPVQSPSRSGARRGTRLRRHGRRRSYRGGRYSK